MIIDFQCCEQWVHVTAQYSNAVLLAVLPYVSDFAERLELPMPTPVTIEHVEEFSAMPKNRIAAQIVLTNGAAFAFEHGYIATFVSPRSFFSQQDPAVIPKFYAPLKISEAEAVDLARQAIRKLGYELEDVQADLEPEVQLARGLGTNVVPHYRVWWRDPRSGSRTVDIEINGNRKAVEKIHFYRSVALERPPPKVDAKPGELPEGHSWRQQNDRGKSFNPEYAQRLVPIVFRAIEDWADKLDLDLPLPVTTNHVKRFYVSNQGGWPHAEVSFVEPWEFTYRNSGLSYFGSPRRFFDSEKLPFRIKDYAGEWRLSEEQAIEVARKAVAELGYPAEFVHTDIEPRIWRPKEIKGMPAIPRLEIEWVYPEPDNRQQWIRVEVDCEKGTVEMLYFDDATLWGKPPPIDVPISLSPSQEPKTPPDEPSINSPPVQGVPQRSFTPYTPPADAKP